MTIKATPYTLANRCRRWPHVLSRNGPRRLRLQIVAFETKTGTQNRPRRSLRRDIAATEALPISTPDYVRAFLTWLNLLFALVPTA